MAERFAQVKKLFKSFGAPMTLRHPGETTDLRARGVINIPGQILVGCGLYEPGDLTVTLVMDYDRAVPVEGDSLTMNGEEWLVVSSPVTTGMKGEPVVFYSLTVRRGGLS